MCIHIPGYLPRFITVLNVPYIILNDVLLKKISVGKSEYPSRQNQASSAGVPTLLFTFQKIFYQKSCTERAYPYNEKSTFREKYVLFSGHHAAADTLQFRVD